MKLLGIDVKIHWSWWLLMLVMSAGSLFALDFMGVVRTLAAAFVVMGVVIFHELAHAMMARYFGYETQSITMFFLGGVAAIQDLGRSTPKEEFWIGLAGPLSNFFLVGLVAPIVLLNPFEAFYALSMVGEEAKLEFTSIGKMLWFFVIVNGLLGTFNLLPAYPMDGGRVLRAALNYFKIKSAMKISHTVTLISAIFLGILGVWMVDPMLIIMAGIILFIQWGEKNRGFRV